MTTLRTTPAPKTFFMLNQLMFKSSLIEGNPQVYETILAAKQRLMHRIDEAHAQNEEFEGLIKVEAISLLALIELLEDEVQYLREQLHPD